GEVAAGGTAGAVGLGRARCELELFRGPEAAADFEAVLEAARRRGDRGRELECLLGLARALYVVSLDDRAGDAIDRSRELYETAYELARQLGDKRRMIQALLGTRWMGDTWPGYWERTAANAREAAALSEEISDDELRLESRMGLAPTLPRGEALALGGPLLREVEARGDLRRQISAFFGARGRAVGGGDFAGGGGHGEAAIRVAAERGVPPVQYPTFTAICLLGLGRYGESWRSLHQE